MASRASDSGAAPFTGPKPSFRHIVSRFLDYYGPYKGLLYADLVCAILLSATDLAFPKIIGRLCDTLFAHGTATQITHALPLLTIGLVALAAVAYACQYFITYWGHLMGARMETDMRQDLFDQYQRLSFSYYDRNNTGEMMSKLVSDLFEISELAHHGPENILISVLLIVGSLVILATINIPMTLLLLVITAALIAYALHKNSQMGAAFLDNRVKIAGVNARLQDTLAGIRVVKSFTNEGIEADKFGVGNIAFLNSKSRAYRKMAEMVAGYALSYGLLYAAVIASGGWFIARGQLTITQLTVYALYVGIFMNPVKMLVEFTEQFQKGYSGFLRLQEVMAEPPGIDDKPGALVLGGIAEQIQGGSASRRPSDTDTTAAAADIRGDVSYRDVHFSYDGTNEVIRGFSLDIPAGRTVALVGPSGGGKTTLCSLLPRFYDVGGGAVSVDGHDVRDVTIKSLRGAIGIVQQEVYLFAGTIGENIAYGRPGATPEQIQAAARDAHIHDFICGLEDGYDTFVGERGARLSGGQKQRIAIARVFLKDPAILILDEATSALDNESERFVQASLTRLAAGRTTLIIAHRLSTIRSADEICVVDNGRLVERGDHDTLLAADGVYARYYRLQFQGLPAHA
ncbi:MAG: ABC transporter ATP-binding protein/permease [Actinomycetes bacterium]|jgi:ATP-binding cassette subfamily B protein|nr:ABC transporter ATP-binding protein/permease [Actinomycetes bacterium]